MKWNAIVARVQSSSELSEKDKKEVKALIRKGGIPADLRGQMWKLCSGAKKKAQENVGLYQRLLRTHVNDSSNATVQIEKDLARSLPRDVISDDGINALRRVLVAYSCRRMNPEVGYTQSMNFVCALLLLYMDEEDAFWCLATIIERCLHRYYEHTMLGIVLDCRVFQDVLSQKIPKVGHQLSALGVTVDSVITQWFLCLFINILPFESVLRVWDSFFLEGEKILFRVALALFKIHEKPIVNASDFETAFQLVRGMPKRISSSQQLLDVAFDRMWLGSFPMSRIVRLREIHRPGLLRDKRHVLEHMQQTSFASSAAASSSSSASTQARSPSVSLVKSTSSTSITSNSAPAIPLPVRARSSYLSSGAPPPLATSPTSAATTIASPVIPQVVHELPENSQYSTKIISDLDPHFGAARYRAMSFWINLPEAQGEEKNGVS